MTHGYNMTRSKILGRDKSLSANLKGLLFYHELSESAVGVRQGNSSASSHCDHHRPDLNTVFAFFSVVVVSHPVGVSNCGPDGRIRLSGTVTTAVIFRDTIEHVE